MKTISISDISLKNNAGLPFRERLETAKLLDRLGVSVIEFGGLLNPKADALLIKAMAAALNDATLCVTAGTAPETAAAVWEALKGAKMPRLQVCFPVSTARMEYVLHKKPDAALQAAGALLRFCKTLCDDVEFVAEDATRADGAFLRRMLSEAAAAGATVLTVEDSAGILLPNETGDFLNALLADLPELAAVTPGFGCSDGLKLANACAVSAVRAGAMELKVSALPGGCISLQDIVTVLSARQDALGVRCGVAVTELKRDLDRILHVGARDAKTPFEDGVREHREEMTFRSGDTIQALLQGVSYLGYDLNEEDQVRVWDAFNRIAKKKTAVDLRELEVIIASEAMQVPDTYRLENYVVTTGNAMDIVAHVKLRRNSETLDGLSIGDGPIDAAFLAIEKITGCHYELDDFQLQSITQGREAMGQTLVKLRSAGKVYSGRGISTDIVGSGIMAYLNALNKIAYEEENG